MFPHSYFSLLKETALPPIEAFINDIRLGIISMLNVKGEHSNVKRFEIMIAYSKLDVNPLADVFGAFRSKTLKEDQLDPVNLISLPHLSFQSAFKMTSKTIDLLIDVEMHELYEKGILGGLTLQIVTMPKRLAMN